MTAGNAQGDIPKGTLTSPKFRITGPKIGFLVGGTCVPSQARVELLVDGHVILTASPKKCRDTMDEQFFDVRQLAGRIAQVRLVDASSIGHLNFDDLKGDFSCIGKHFLYSMCEIMMEVDSTLEYKTALHSTAQYCTA